MKLKVKSALMEKVKVPVQTGSVPACRRDLTQRGIRKSSGVAALVCHCAKLCRYSVAKGKAQVRWIGRAKLIEDQ